MVTSGAEYATECCIACVDDEGVDRFLSTADCTYACTRAAPAHAFNAGHGQYSTSPARDRDQGAGAQLQPGRGGHAAAGV
jgi:hypothetical protein